MDQAPVQFEYGDKVEHPVFGIGSVLAFIGDGDRLKLLIKFKDVGEKKIAVRYAKLKRLSERPTLVGAAVAEEAPRAEVATLDPVKVASIKKTILPAADATADFPAADEPEDDDDEDLEDESLEDLADEEDEEDEEDDE